MKNNKTIKFLIAILIVATAFGLEWKWLDYPAARENSTMIVDSLNQRIILFGGGRPYEQTWFNDAWEMPLDTSLGYHWLRLPVSGTPPTARFDHSAVYDSRNQRMIVLFGNAGSNFFHDVWVLNLTVGNESWEMLNTSGIQTADRCAQLAIYNSLRNSVIVFGGAGNYVRYNDVWELNLDSMVWGEIVVSGSRPAIRCFPGGLFDKDNNRLIIFGGNADDFYNDVWSLDLTPGSEQWTELFPTGSVPAERSGFAYGSDPKRNRFYVFAGWNYPPFQFFNDLYVLDLPTLTWTRLYPSGELPETRRGSSGNYDYFNDNLLVFGGDAASGYSSETFFIHIDTINISTSEWKSQPKFNSYPALFVNTIASGSVRIRYMLPKLCNINVKILDAKGRVVRNIFSGKISSRSEWLTWDSKDNSGKNMSSGVYYCLLETEDTGISKKFIIAK